MAVKKIVSLNQHQNPATNENQFDIENYLNANWNDIIEVVDNNADELTTAQNNITALQNDNTTNKQDIANLKTENEELKAENERLNQDLNALPSNTAEGEYITLTDSADSRFNKFKVIGKSTQKTREGYNLFNYDSLKSTTRYGVTFTVNEDKSITANGTATQNSSFDLIGSVNNYPLNLRAGNYVLTGCDGGSVSSYYLEIYNGTRYYTCTNDNIKFTFDTDTSIRCYFAFKEGATFNNFTFYPMLVAGTEKKEYEQYGTMPSPKYPNDIQNVTGDVDIITCNENLVLNSYSTPKTDKDFYSNVSSNFTPLEDGWGRFVADNTKGSSNIYTIAFISFKKFKNIIKLHTAYRLLVEFRNVNMIGNTNSDYMCIATGEGTEPFSICQFNKSQLSNNLKYSINLAPYPYENEPTYLFRSFLSVSAGNSTSLEVRISLLEKDSTETEVKVGNQEFVFPLSEGQVLRERDYLADDGIHHKRNTVSFNGTENWKYDSTYNRWHIAALVLYNSVVGAGKAELQCNYFKYSNSTQDLNKISDASSSDWYFYIEDKYLNGKTFPEWIQEKYEEGKPLIVEYDILEEKQSKYVEPYTEEQQKVYNEIVNTAKTYKTVTNIFSTNEVSPVFEVNYRKDIETMINSVNKAVLSNA